MIKICTTLKDELQEFKVDRDNFFIGLVTLYSYHNSEKYQNNWESLKIRYTVFLTKF